MSDLPPPSVAGARLLRLYPSAWRERYLDEVLAILESRPPRFRGRVDLLRGALDAHLHPAAPSAVPGVAAIVGGAAAAVVAAGLAAAPAPPDWPGYLLDTLPVAALAAIALGTALVGAFLRLGDSPRAFDRIAIDVAVAGHLAWAAALGVALLGLEYGAATGLASAAAATGTALVGVALLRVDEWPIAPLLATAAVALVVGGTVGWLGYGLAWTTIGLLGLARRSAGGRSPAV